MSLSVLFVCTANICRSAFMELYARDRAGDDTTLTFSSAGTRGFVDHPMDGGMAGELTRRGIDHSGFTSRLLTGALIEEADLILTAEQTHRQFILDDHPGSFRKVLTLGQAAQAAEATSRLTPGLTGRDALAEIARHRGRAESEHDIADPYARGAEAAEACAVQISAMLEVVLPVLRAPAVLAPVTTVPAHQ